MANPALIGNGLHVAGSVTQAVDARRAEAGMWARNAATTVPRQGVVWAGQSVLVAGTSTTGPPMTVTVAPLHFVASKASGEGIYRAVVQSATLVDIDAAPGSNSRIDVVWVAQQDAASPSNPDGTTQGVVGVTTGTPAASPTKPTVLTVGAIELATVTVSAGNTNTNSAVITQTAKWTALRGTPIPVANQSDRDALAAYDGLQVWRLDGHRLERYTSDSGSWGAGWDDSENTYLPTWAAASGGTVIGTSGSVLGWYQRHGSRVNMHITMTMGTASFNGGNGLWTFTGPPIAPSVRSVLAVRAFIPNAGNAGNPQPAVYNGNAFIDVSTGIISPYLPARPDRPGLSRVQNANGSGTIGTGIPQIATATGYSADAYTWTSAGTPGTLEIFGSYVVN